MKKLIKIASLCIIASLVLASCSDDTVTPAADKNYYPTTVGSTWTYDGVNTEDTTGTTRDISASSYAMSSTVKDSLNYMGKSAVLIVNTYNNGQPDDTTYISKTATQIYQYMSFTPGDFGGFGLSSILDFGSRWVLIADYNQASWPVFDTTVTGITLPLPSPFGPTPAKITAKVTSAKSGVSSLTVGTQSVQVQEFITTIAFTAVLTTVLGEQTVPMTFVNKTYVSENIGIVKTEALPTTISFPANLIAPIHINGNKETLKTYTIVK
ncbi:MAG: hypothetical protein IPM69_12770 [Ignavibacteria bacterium]|nr:hypothetical protein [Ignavibacteria bacterium]